MDVPKSRVPEVDTLALATSEQLERILEAMDHLEHGVVLYGPDDRLVFSNTRFREIYSEVADLLVPGTQYAEIARAYFRRGFEARTGLDESTYVRGRVEKHRNPDEGDYEFQHGDSRWLLVSDRRTADGGVIGVRVDITARKRAEQELATSESRFRSLLEMTSDWYWEQDTQFRFTIMSQGLRNLGQAPESLIGRRRWELDYGGLTEEQWEAHKRALEAHEPFRGLEFTFTRPTGEERWVSVAGEPTFDPQGLFTGYRGVGTDITERKRYETKIRELAEYDFLTGLPNRNLLSARFAFAARSAGRSDQPMALLFIDLDRFKTVNDTLGHLTGDKLLKQIATRLMHLVRATDTVCRHGGDEFLVLLPEVGEPGNAARVARDVLAELSKPYDIDEFELVVTPSIGISLYPADGADLQSLIRSADAAMYHSKAMGRNQMSFFKVEMNAKVAERLVLENGLRRATARGELFLEYQPVFAIPDGSLCGVEALARWRHPERGLVSPAVFVPIAEDSGLILEIGEWVMRECCRQIAAWRVAGLEPPPVRLNLSGIQFRQKNLLESIEAALAAYALEPACLELEVTESVLLSEAETTSGLLKSLSEAGYKLAIDDFGTGYSSLAYLTRLPIDKLKIDKSFVRDIFTDRGGAAVTEAIVGLAASLRLRVTAEGVETQMQLDFLRNAGCDEAQGYLLSPPLPPEGIVALMREALAAT